MIQRQWIMEHFIHKIISADIILPFFCLFTLQAGLRRGKVSLEQKKFDLAALILRVHLFANFEPNSTVGKFQIPHKSMSRGVKCMFFILSFFSEMQTGWLQRTHWDISDPSSNKTIKSWRFLGSRSHTSAGSAEIIITRDLSDQINPSKRHWNDNGTLLKLDWGMIDEFSICVEIRAKIWIISNCS